jgi:peptidoglycan/xylan/chitin deacetylase (PgdA/CDA1 family)
MSPHWLRPRCLAERWLAFACAGLAVVVMAGCATPPPVPVADAPPAAVPVPVVGGPVINRDNDLVLVVARDDDTFAKLAERYLGDATRGWWIAQLNGGGKTVKGGQVVVIPLHPRNVVGVQADGYQAIPILCYHRFGVRPNKLTVTPAAFEAQMEYLARNDYHVITFAQLKRFLDGREPLPPKSVLITIDDGYRATYEVAYPVLRKFGFPATVFLYSDFVGATDAMTWPQMKDMSASGLIDIQPHSKTHSNLTLRLPGETDVRYRERLRREVEAPATVLRERLAETSRVYAYPYGDVNEVVVDLLTKAGIQQGATVTPGGNGFFAYPYMLRRTMVFGNEDMDAFKAKLATFVRTSR